VSVVSDLSGNVTNVVCPEFLRLNHACLKKSRESSLVGLFVKKLADVTTGTRGSYCEFARPRNMLSGEEY
jgi:hypothetical protein